MSLGSRIRVGVSLALASPWACSGSALAGAALMNRRIVREGVYRAHRAIDTAMREVLGDQLRQTIELGIGPEVRIEPGELMGRSAAQRDAHHLLGRVEDDELVEHLLSLAVGLVRREQRAGSR